MNLTGKNINFKSDKPLKQELIINLPSKTTRIPINAVFNGSNPVHAFGLKVNDSTLYIRSMKPFRVLLTKAEMG